MLGWVCAGVVTVSVVAALWLLVRAELNERAWRRKLREQEAAVLLREIRYGDNGRRA